MASKTFGADRPKINIVSSSLTEGTSLPNYIFSKVSLEKILKSVTMPVLHFIHLSHTSAVVPWYLVPYWRVLTTS